MSCSYEPYKITSNLEAVGEFIFIDNDLSRRVTVFVDCAGIVNPPCADAIALHIEDDCPDGCKVFWYECPSEMGRQYTIFPTPCGVKVTSFEDGLVVVGGCDATLFGSELFCFGKIYTNLGAFDSPDKSVTTFEFDGHTFTVQGVAGACNDLYDCPECRISSQTITIFEDLPTPPEDVSAPEPLTDEVISDIDIPETTVIPAEGRARWHWDTTTSTFGTDTLCEDEKALTSWVGGTDLPVCSSDDNPSIATLPSGHTIVAYENRKEDGITKITVAILSSSVRENIRSHRELGTGTLLNNLVEAEGIATFIIYEEMNIASNASGVPLFGEKIGFLTGPLAGNLYTITKLTRVLESNVVRHEFQFTAGLSVKFPDKNNVYDVNWFVIDNQGSSDLPSSQNIITVLDLPYHLDGAGNAVPVANPSITVAQNNQMIANEQNVYIAYQAFEDSQWRVYLREIVLGGNEESSPIYVAPYLFDDQRQIEILQVQEPMMQPFTLGENLWDYYFTSHGLGVRIGDDPWPGVQWYELADWIGPNPLDPINPWPMWSAWHEPSGSSINLSNSSIYLCDGDSLPLALRPCAEDGPQGRPTCIGVWNSRGANPDVDHCIVETEDGAPFTRALATKGSFPTINHDDLAMTLRFAIIPNTTSIIDLPEVWIMFGRNVPVLQSHAIGWRLQILRGSGVIQAAAGQSKNHLGDLPNTAQSVSCADGGCGGESCFVFRLYDSFNRTDPSGIEHVNDRSNSTGDDTDTPLREIWKCVQLTDPDYVLNTGWNEWRVETYRRGRKRHFDVYLKNSITNDVDVLMAQFQEWDPMLMTDTESTTIYDFGAYHGFGFAHGNDKVQIIIDRIKVDELTISTVDEVRQQIQLDGIGTSEGVVFYEDDLTHDGWLNDPGREDRYWTSPAITSGLLVPSGSYHLYNLNQLSRWGWPEFYSTGWTYTRMIMCDNTGGDSFYEVNGNATQPAPQGSLARLQPPGQLLCSTSTPENGLWSYTVLSATTHDLNGIEQSNNVSMVLSVARIGQLHNGAYPHVWFVMRLQAKNDSWWRGYRVRITKFTAQTNLDASVMPNLGNRPAITAGESYWKVSLYKPKFSGGPGGSYTEPVDEEVYIKIVSEPGAGETNIDWIDPVPGTGGPASTAWPYFRIDLTIENGPFVRLKVYVGDDSGGDTGADPVKFDEINYSLLHTFDTSDFSGGELERPWYGFALFSGSKTDPELDDNDYYANCNLNYIKLEKLSETSSPTGVCCRGVGGCVENVISTDCDGSGDFWVEGETCWDGTSGFDCTTIVTIGAGCTDDGVCHDNITEIEAANQGIGTCTDCEWIAGTDCFIESDDYRNCPPGTGLGKCCRPSQRECIDDVTLTACQLFYGQDISETRYFAGQNCNEPGVNSSDCPLVQGACCRESGCFIETSAGCAAFNDGTYAGDNTDCVSHPCPTDGACCDGDGGCTQQTLAECLLAGGDFLGIGVSCTPDPCSYPDIWACCYDDGTCTNTIESACTGTWLYSSLCADGPCPEATGACCDSTETCEDGVTSDTCQNSGRTYWGDGSLCSNVTCDPPTGACCIGLNCAERTLQECASLGGSYLGNFTHCITGSCTEDDPYVETSINYKPEDLWIIETAPDQYITRVLYHMQEEILVSILQNSENGTTTNVLDFMFLIDHSGTMADEIIAVATAVPQLARNIVSKGLDVRFGFTFFGRGSIGIPEPLLKVLCDCGTDSHIADGLQSVIRCQDGSSIDGLGGSNEDGFTRNVEYLQQALNCWGTTGGTTSPWSAIQFVIEDSQFNWRPSASKFIFFITDTHDHECGTDCEAFSTSRTDAQNSLETSGTVLVPVVNLDPGDNIDNAPYLSVAEASGWTGGLFDSNSEDYGDLFEEVVNNIDAQLRIDHATIIERATAGTESTYLKKGEVIITYDDDLSDLWTFNKSDFEFSDAHVPYPGTNTKQLLNFPFTLASERIYGIDAVHIQGNPNNWVSFGTEGALLYSHPNVGWRASGISNNPLLISTNSIHPKVYVNNRNQVMVAYENQTSGTPQIEIQGTGDFHQNSITGPKASRILRLLNSDDFTFLHTITLPGEGVNQLCDFVIDNSDITHIVWQSSRDGYWEIYYANSFNMFDPVRVTRANSRSSHPSLDIGKTGSIFVVYHDDRFGPFNILLSSKDEERVIPLLEQDAYLASLRTGYTHYTNTLPVFLDNPSGAAQDLGQFWASKKSDEAGNDSENFVYKVSETTGTPSDGFDLASSGQEAIAFSSTTMWGITSEGVLSRLGHISDDQELVFNVTTIGTIDFDIAGFFGHLILDIEIDKFDRIWVLIYERETGSESHRLRLEYISGFNASTVARAIVKEDIVGSSDGGSIAITSDNKFHITWSDSVDVILSSSSYPTIAEGVATFDFQEINALIPAFTPVSMTADASDTLFAVSSENDLYTISKLLATTTLQTSLTTESGAGTEASLPVGTTSGIAYQLLDTTPTGSAQFFHIRIDFYDNIAFEGDPFLSVDSRENLEAFINEETLDDPYAVTGMDARGIFLSLNQIGIVFFDASHFVPGFSRLSQPYSFEPNQTYFPRIFQIDEASSVRESGAVQTNSFSCTKCSRFGNNNFNTNACSYSFVMPNSGVDTETFNFQIDFYADTGKQHLIRRFEAIPGSDDLQYMEVDNNPAIDQWNEFGLPIAAGDSAFIQIHPVLDPTAGFLCGVTYTVQVNECHGVDEICSGFTIITPSNWSASLIGDEETIYDQFAPNEEVMLGLSMKHINNKLYIAWRTPENNLKFAQLNDNGWAVQTILSDTGDSTIYCDLADINGFPSIAHIILRGSRTVETVLTLEDGSWNEWPAMSHTQSDALFNPRSLLEYNNAPMVTFVGTGVIGQSTVSLNSGRSVTFDLSPGCFPPFAGLAGGSCTTTLTNVNGLPAVAWQSAGVVNYAVWNTTSETFAQQPVVSLGDVPVVGKVALAEIDGQPAVAYLKVVGSGAQLKYKRFNGAEWVNVPTSGQIQDFNKHIAMAAINEQPYIVYSIKTSPTTSQLRYAFYNGTRFVDGLIEDDLNQVDHVVDIVEYNNEPAVVISANPLRVYFFRQQPSESTNEIRPVFFCECASKIFTNRLTHLNEVARWESSANGFADTSVTDSAKDSLRPIMSTRKSGAAIILWEDYNESANCTDPPCIRAATFRNVNQDQLRASGTKSWFDYDFGISGKDPDITLDIFDRVNSIYEKPKLPSDQGLHGRQIDRNELPGNELYGKVCDFLVAEDTVDPTDPGGCDLSSLENNVISFDQFISSQIVRKIRVKDEFVQYYTYNASRVLTPIVSTCNISLEIHGTPEIVALRFRNEDKIVWSPWCPWSPEISDFVMERQHQISGGSGVKEICIQAMTYKGITTEFCIPVVADYETVVFETRFYKNTDSNGDEITNFDTVNSDGAFGADDTKLVGLPLSEGISVASLAPEGGSIPSEMTILVEIIPNQEFDEGLINFDIIQQGTNDQRGRVANKGKNNKGRVLYRGDFTIEKEDKVFNIDGLARINPTFPSSCEEAGNEVVSTSDTYTRDIFNEIGQDSVVESTEADPLAEFRQTTSGRVGVSVDIRSSEDPYFIFGDPNYSLKKTDGQRLGVPSRTAEDEITAGETPDQGGDSGGAGG